MTIASGPIIQVCWVVEDIAAAETFHREHFGAGPFLRIPDVRFGPEEATYRGQPADFTAHVSMAYIGDLQLELIQPVAGESIYTEFLARSGPGLHHICFETPDLAASIERARAAGMEIVQQGVMGGGMMSFAYVDGAGWGAPYVELAELGDDIRALYASIKAR
ncbi:VOC family protein [Nocardioides humilatus]|uniref:VOC family protein n=1 Tax=Nocardioides humilatus TaxID=2607660 RepID=A0A5B1L835_9ACTN|nr:VOC family protein [Nocardioides humilatus]KAA1416881.1 VOC family protein [Nocardioides humilatus]